MFFLACPCSTRSSLEMLAVAIINEGIQVARSFHVYATSSTTISSIGSSKRNELLTAVMNGAIPTVARLAVHFCMVVKHNESPACILGDLLVFFPCVRSYLIIHQSAI